MERALAEGHRVWCGESRDEVGTVWAEVWRAGALLSVADRRRLALLTIFQASLSFLDLAAVTALGLVAGIAASAVSGQSIQFLAPIAESLGNPPRLSTVVFIAMGAGLLMIAKTGLSFWGTRLSFRFLASRQSMISSRLADDLLSRPLLHIQKRSSQETVYALTAGIGALTLGVLGQAVIVASELALLVVLGVGLFFVDPRLTLFTVGYFAAVALLLHKLLSHLATRLGEAEASASALSTAAMQEALRGYREVVVTGRRGVYTARFQELVAKAASIQADRQMVTTIGKYVFEVALVIGAALLVGSQVQQGDLAGAASIITVFLAASSRMMPSLLRLQGATLVIKFSLGNAQYSRDLIEELEQVSGAEPIPTTDLERSYELSAHGYEGFNGSITVQNIALTYPGSETKAISDISLQVPDGTSIAFVGTTGAGKSSLADILLGVVDADKGSIRIGGLTPAEAVRKWPGALAYVPQEVAIVNGDIRTNVAMGMPKQLIHDDRVWEALERAQLAGFLKDRKEGLDTLVGEYGFKLSGGQRQRLGIARALYTRPRVLVLDEATSALDAETEAAVSQTIASMAGNVTLVIIAHRLATIRNCTQVAYLDGGRLRALGNFESVRLEVPDFDRQAQLLGL